jgi:hypothetical protein
MMAKLATKAIGAARSSENRKLGSIAGKIRVPACIFGGRLRAAVCDPPSAERVLHFVIGALLGQHVYT